MNLKRFFQKEFLEAGCDEAGRGCLAGPVFAAAVILDDKKIIKGLDDSKKLSKKKRNDLRKEIEDKAKSFGVAFLTNQEIDKYNILKSSFMAMHKAIEKLNVEPELLLIDGNRFIPFKKINHECVVKGDGKFQSIAAASILAKTYRDEFMLKIHNEFPEYNWEQNKGYPTNAHCEVIMKSGATKYHRMSFTLIKKQLELAF